MPRTLGLDVGDRRIGVALSDAGGILASPSAIIERTNDAAADARRIVDIAVRNGVATIIVGLPVSMDGTIGSQAEKVETFTRELRQQSPVPVEFRDERLSTVSAKRLKAAGPKDKKRHHDAMAAAVILQSYLDEIR